MSRKQDIADRRKVVLALKLQGHNDSAVASTLGVHRNTVVNDMREIRREQRQEAQQKDKTQILGSHLSELKKLEEKCLEEASECPPNQIASLMRAALDYRKERIKLLKDTGLIETIAQKSEVNIFTTEDGVNLEHAGKEHVIAELAKEERKLQKLLRDSGIDTALLN